MYKTNAHVHMLDLLTFSAWVRWPHGCSQVSIASLYMLKMRGKRRETSNDSFIICRTFTTGKAWWNCSTHTHTHTTCWSKSHTHTHTHTQIHKPYMWRLASNISERKPNVFLFVGSKLTWENKKAEGKAREQMRPDKLEYDCGDVKVFHGPWANNLF